MQPFDGEFFAEVERVDLGPDGKRIIIGRSDIEWRLHGIPNFVIEFKVIGGGGPRSNMLQRAWYASSMGAMGSDQQRGRCGHSFGQDPANCLVM